MSYLHCPTCQRAFNLATQPQCPYCPVHATAVEPADDIVAATEQLARAMSRATAAERVAAAARMQRLALPSGDRTTTASASPASPDIAPAIITAIQHALDPQLAARPPAPPTLADRARHLVDRLAPRVPQLASGALDQIHQLAPRMPKLVRRAARMIETRVRALAA